MTAKEMDKIKKIPKYLTTLMVSRGVAIFAKAFLGFPAQKSGKNYATANACGCPSRPASLVAYYATSFSQ